MKKARGRWYFISFHVLFLRTKIFNEAVPIELNGGKL